jgi:lipid II:glycine glycyltransferase (peptidoglycan interpeptide bridge formation enzyme)
VYVETAHRDHFTPRGLAYFERMWDSLNSREERLDLYCAHVDGHLAAATIMVRVGTHAWYSYGASTTADRDVRPSNALQWRMISDAHAAGCEIYDLRGIADTLDPANHLFGLVQFKVGTGGFAQEYAGEWDYVLRPAWAKGFRTYQSRRG